MTARVPSANKYALRTGVYCGLFSIAYYLFGLTADLLSNTTWTIAYYLFIFIFTLYFVYRFRKKEGGGYLPFKNAFNISLLIVIISGTMFSSWSAVYQTYISPATGKELLLQAEKKLQEQGLEPEEVKNQMILTEKMLEVPLLTIGIGIFGSTLIGSVIALIVAPILKKEEEIHGTDPV